MMPHRHHSQSSQRYPYWSTSCHCQISSRCHHCDTLQRQSLFSCRSTSTQSRGCSHSRHRTSHRTPKHCEVRHCRVTINDPSLDHFSLEDSSDSKESLKLGEPSLSNVPHKWGGPPMDNAITVACITDCPTITVHTGKRYKALIDSGAAVSLLRYSTYKSIEDCYKTPIQPMTAKLNTANSSLMSTLGITALHLHIVEFKFVHNFTICDQLPDTELLFGIDIQKKPSISYAWDHKKLLPAKRWKIHDLHMKLQAEGYYWHHEVNH